MARPKNENLDKKTIRFYKGDCEIIDSFFPQQGYSLIVREVVHKFARKLAERENKQTEPEDEQFPFEPSDPDELG